MIIKQSIQKDIQNILFLQEFPRRNHQKCLDLALKIDKIFKCQTLSRVDFIFNNKQNKIYFLEINSQPGMTKIIFTARTGYFSKN